METKSYLLEDIASYIGVGGYSGYTDECQLAERIKDEFDRLHEIIIQKNRIIRQSQTKD